MWNTYICLFSKAQNRGRWFSECDLRTSSSSSSPGICVCVRALACVCLCVYCVYSSDVTSSRPWIIIATTVQMVPAFPVVSAVIRAISVWPSDVCCHVGQVFICLVLRNDWINYLLNLQNPWFDLARTSGLFGVKFVCTSRIGKRKKCSVRLVLPTLQYLSSSPRWQFSTRALIFRFLPT